MVLVLAFGRYTRKETVPGFILSERGLVEVRPLQGGRVSRVFVREGQTVAAGDPLIEFTSDVGSLESGPALDIQIAETDRQIAAFRQRRDASSSSYAAERERLGDQIIAQNSLISILAQQRLDQESAIELAASDLARVQSLQAQGFAPRSELDRRRRALLTEREALREIEGEIATANARIADLEAQISAMPARQADQQAALDAEIARVGQQRERLVVARGYVLRAPVAGTVSRVLARTGLTPASNGSLLTIVPQGGMLYARLLVPTRAVGFIEIGQEANIQVEAFPFQRFGMIPGHVRAIHPVVVRPGELAYPIEQVEPVYEIDVFLTREHVVAYGDRRQVRPGMLLTADLPIDRRQLWQQLFDPLLASGKRASQ
jgi:membrane fusion protein